MSSFHQNRQNAQFSTGPRTEAGKQASSQNALKHGLSARFIPLSDEERPRFQQFEADLRDQIKPRGPLQEVVFRELLCAAWKRDVVNNLIFEASQSSRDLFSDEVADRVRKLQRHKADQDRAFNRAMRQLIELQTLERVRSITLIKMEDRQPGVDFHSWAEGLADYSKITKQSRQLSKHYANPKQNMNLEAELQAKMIRRQNAESMQNQKVG